MPIAYDEARLRHVLTDFYNATGVSIQLIRPDLSRLWESAGTRNHYCDLVQKTADGKRACLLSDEQLLRHCRDTRQMQIHVCHAGLIDIAVPIKPNELPVQIASTINPEIAPLLM